jgi:hypothetical protein
VVVGAAVPPAVLVGALVVVVGVVAVAVVVVLDVLLVEVLCVAAGALAAVTVFVCEPPQPPSATALHAPSSASNVAGVSARVSFRCITAMVFGVRPTVPPPADFARSSGLCLAGARRHLSDDETRIAMVIRRVCGDIYPMRPV